MFKEQTPQGSGHFNKRIMKSVKGLRLLAFAREMCSAQFHSNAAQPLMLERSFWERQYLTDLFVPETSRCALSTRNWMEIFLRHLADTGFHNGVSKTLGLPRSTVGKTFDFVLEKWYGKTESWINFFLNMAEINKAG